ncbi:homoserine kinase [Atractiella rhizophila]|nr:homoserine kinase [Atractiella rhizophila]
MTAEKRWRIRVPATSANIGPGFDVLGLAYKLYLTLDIRLIAMEQPSHPVLRYSGEGSSEAPLDPYKNLITRVALYVLRCHGIMSFFDLPRATKTQLEVDVTNDIPFGRGLGSSGAAVVAGVLLASAIGDLSLSSSRALDFTLMVERHPDNVTAALLGGFVGSFIRSLNPSEISATSVPLSEVLPEFPSDANESWGLIPKPPAPPGRIGNWVKYQINNAIKAIVVIPKFEVSTAAARNVLPPQYSRADTVFNLQRLAVLTTALATAPPNAAVIYEGMQDRLHQPFRAGLIPALPIILSLSPDTLPGLLGICLSGAGPTILALATDNFEAIGEAVVGIFRDTPMPGATSQIEASWRVLDIDEAGSSLESLDA